MSSFLSLADLLKLPERQETDQHRLVSAVQRWLTTHHHWLVIWDNLEDPDLLQRFLPPARQEAILITTRRPSLGTLAHPLELTPLTQDEGALLLLRRTNVLPASISTTPPPDLCSLLPAEYTTLPPANWPS